MAPIFDLILAFSVVSLAYQSVSRADLFTSVVLFITFGVLVSLVWIRLAALDLAIVEAALGAGITGALFLNALGRITKSEEERGGGA